MNAKKRMSNLEKSIKIIKIFFFLFVFVQGIFYLFLIPPWQSPDETHYLGYGVLLTQNAELGSEEHKKISKDIMKSMRTFHSWKYMNLPPPEKFPEFLGQLPFYGYIGILAGRGPFYYLTNAFILSIFKTKETINQFYLIRAFSFILFMLVVFFTYLSARLIFKGHIGYALAGVCLAGLLPQFLIISTSVNPVNLVIFLSSVFLYFILYSLYHGKNLFALLFGPLIIAVGFFTHRGALFMIPPFLVYLLTLFIQSIKERRKLFKYLASLGVLLVLIIGLYFVASNVLPDSFMEKVNRESGIKQLKSQWARFAHYFTEGISTDTSRTVSQFMDGFFKSFWYFAGWLRFGYLLDIYSVLKIICLFSVIGVFKYIYSYIGRREVSVNFSSFLILTAAGFPIILGTLIHCFPRHFVAQGRYLFPAISALAILFVLGLKEITPKRFENWVPIFIIVGFIVLNIYTLFNSLIRFFYYFTNL